jgi:hypothetical protein
MYWENRIHKKFKLDVIVHNLIEYARVIFYVHFIHVYITYNKRDFNNIKSIMYIDFYGDMTETP